MIEKGFVLKLLKEIVGLEKIITDLAINSKNIITTEIFKKIRTRIEEKDNKILILKNIINFMKSLSSEQSKLFKLYFVYGASQKILEKEFKDISQRTIYRKIDKIKKKAEEYLL